MRSATTDLVAADRVTCRRTGPPATGAAPTPVRSSGPTGAPTRSDAPISGEPTSTQSFIAGISDPYSVAVDPGHVYWANFVTNSIGRANHDGTGSEPNFITGASDPYGVAVDSGHIYWANSATSSIGRANLDGTAVNQSFISVSGTPHGVATRQRLTSTGRLSVARAPIRSAEPTLTAPGSARASSPAALSPSGVAVDAEPRLLVECRHLHRSPGRTSTARGSDISFITGTNFPLGIARRRRLTSTGQILTATQLAAARSGWNRHKPELPNRRVLTERRRDLHANRRRQSRPHLPSAPRPQSPRAPSAPPRPSPTPTTETPR